MPAQVPDRAGWGATAAGASPPDVRQCETGSRAPLERTSARSERRDDPGVAAGRAPASQSENYVGAGAVAGHLGISVSTVYAMVARGSLPRPRKTAPGRGGRSRWLLSEVDAAFRAAQP